MKWKLPTDVIYPYDTAKATQGTQGAMQDREQNFTIPLGRMGLHSMTSKFSEY